ISCARNWAWRLLCRRGTPALPRRIGIHIRGREGPSRSFVVTNAEGPIDLHGGTDGSQTLRRRELDSNRRSLSRTSPPRRTGRSFALDSPLEGGGFEPSVPPATV